VTLRDAAGLTATSTVTVTVNQTQSYISVTPGSVALGDGQRQQFTATTRDQFGNLMIHQPAFTWSLIAGAGSITGGGLYSAPASGGGTGTVRVSAGGLSVYATVSYHSTVPAPPTNLTVAPVGSGWLLLRWLDNSNNETGFVIQRSTDGGVWRTVGSVGANGTFFDDTTASRSHSYSYRVYAYNNFGISGFSNASSNVRPAVSDAVFQLLASGTGKNGSGLWYL
jgi:hypothetical protein